MIKDLSAFCRELSWDREAENILAPCWETLCANSTDSFPFFMEKSAYTEYAAKAEVPSDALLRMETVAQIVRENPVLCQLANMLHYAFYKSPSMINLGSLPSVEKFCGENSGIFHLFIVLSSIPCVAEHYAAWGIPEKYASDSAKWISGTIDIYRAAHNGIPGHTPGQTYWPRLTVDGKLFRIGRLEYKLANWTKDFPAVYVNRSDRTLCVLCRDQAKYDKDGFLIPENSTETPAFTAHLKVRDNHVTGTPVQPNGLPRIGRKVTLDLTQWEALCAPWDLVGDIHIPGGGNLTLESVKESLLEARQFFRKHFSTDVKAFTCGSWIFNPAWQKELPGSNLAKFQRNVYMSSVVKHPAAGLFFVYGRNQGDPRQWQQESSLHRAFCNIFNRNESLAYSFIFITAEDLDQFGTEYYLNEYSR
ncbi:MAG: hypothetical protein J6S58_01065 [Lentisphaeria bacterium]|nr:hypothetical protein [Lentisphaeria bacterium]